jgi:hypothetical protein
VVSVPPLRAPLELGNAVGNIVAPGEKFDATDIVISGHSRGLILVWNIGREWIVATELRGLADNDPT